MHHDEFIGQVQSRARLASRGDAEKATRATLETLGERIPEHLADNLAAQLPHEIGEHLRRTIMLGGEGTGERFDRREFIARVSERIGPGTDEMASAFQCRVVFEVMEDAVTAGMIDKIEHALPPDLVRMAEAGSRGEMR